MKKKTEAVNAEFEIIETKLIPATEETKGVQLFNPENKEQVIQAFINAASLSFSTTPADCKKLVKESAKLTIKDKDDKEGFEKVKAANWKLVKLRTGLENERKNLTEPFNRIKSGIDKIAKEDILGVTAKEEERTKGLLDQWKEWEQEEADRIEREAKEKLDTRVAELESAGIVFDGAFYSVGTVSVDLVTIGNLSDEHFEELKSRTAKEGERIAEAKRIVDLHNERRELALPFIAYWTEEEKQMNFGEVADKSFEAFMERIQKSAKDFEDEKAKQEEEKVNQAKERKALNYEKRSFKLEKAGFEVDEDGNLIFMNGIGSCRWDKSQLESLTNEEFEERFEKSIAAKKGFEDQAKTAAEDKVKADEEKAKTEKRISRRKMILELGFEEVNDGFGYHNNFVGSNLVFDTTDEEFSKSLIRWTKAVQDKNEELEKAKEEERLQKLPEIERAERYIEEVMKVQIPALKTAEIAEIIADFKNKIKLASDEALKSLKK